jgi:hypothetical protein
VASQTLRQTDRRTCPLTLRPAPPLHSISMPDMQICPDILEVAVEKLERINSSSAPRSVDEWTVVRRKRERSIVYRLTDSASGTTLYYKVLAEPRYEGIEKADSLSNRLSRTESLTDQLLNLTAGTSASPAPMLVADAHRRTVVTLGVEGRQIRQGVLRTLIPGGKLSTKQAALIGEGCAYIERCSDRREVTFDWERFSSQVEYHLARAQTGRRAADRLRSKLEQAASDLLVRRAAVYVHGDLSPTNIIVSGERVHMIDFSWFSGFRGYDLGLFSYRLRAMDKVLWGRRRRLAESLMTAYKSVSGPRYDRPSLRVVDLFLLVRGLSSPWPKMRVLAQRSLHRVITDSWEDEREFDWWWEASR